MNVYSTRGANKIPTIIQQQNYSRGNNLILNSKLVLDLRVDRPIARSFILANKKVYYLKEARIFKLLDWLASSQLYKAAVIHALICSMYSMLYIN